MPVIFCLFEASAQASPTKQITVAITSDIHGWLSTSKVFPKRAASGLLHLSEFIEQARVKDPDLILIDAGDMLRGSPLSHYYLFKTKNKNQSPFVNLLRKLRYDAIVIGNHDIELRQTPGEIFLFDFQLPWISANIYNVATDETIVAPYVQLNRSGLNIVILGFTTNGIFIWLNDSQKGELSVKPIDRSVDNWLHYLESQLKPDLIICVFHAGSNPIRDDENLKLARYLPRENLEMILDKHPEIDLAISGHNHYLSPSRSGKSVPYLSNVPLVEPGSWGKALLLLTLRLSDDNSQNRINSIETSVLKADQNLKLSRKYNQLLPEEYKLFLSEKTDFWVTHSSQDQANLCLNEIAAKAVMTDGVSGSLLPYLIWKDFPDYIGDRLTRLDLFRLIYYDNRFTTVLLSQRDLYLLRLSENRGWPSSTPGKSLFYAGEVPLSDRWERYGFYPRKWFDRKYKFIVSDYHANGGSGFFNRLFIEKNNASAHSESFIRDIVFRYLTSHQESMPESCAFLEAEKPETIQE